MYTGAITLTESITGTVQIRIAGIPSESDSPTAPVVVLPDGVPTFTHAPDLTHVVTDSITNASMISDEVITCYESQTSIENVLASIVAVHGSIVGRLPRDNCYQVMIPMASTSSELREAIAILKTLPKVTIAEPDFIENATAATCSFPTCADTNSLSYSLLNLNAAHSVSTGFGVIVAVIDSGLSLATDKPLLALALPGKNFTSANGGVSSDTNDVPQFPHGTWVSGIVAATAPDASIVPYKVCEWDPEHKPKPTNSCPTVEVISAVQTATNRMVKVMNLSLGNYTPSAKFQDAIIDATAQGIVVVAAAGNDNNDNDQKPFYPASYPGVLAVGGVNVESPVNPKNYTDTIWDFDSCSSATGKGPTTTASASNYGSNVLISAPSVCVETNGYRAGTPSYCTGTSCAAPFVAGSAALIEENYPTWTASQLTQQLINSAQEIYLLNSDNVVVNQQIGPRLDPLAAVGAIRVTQEGDVESTPLNMSYGEPSTSFTLGSFVALLGNTAPCEARTNVSYAIYLPCVFDLSVNPSSLTEGTYNFFIQFGSGAGVGDFAGIIDLSVPGLTFLSANGTNASIETPTRGYVTLYSSGLKIASFVLQYEPQSAPRKANDRAKM